MPPAVLLAALLLVACGGDADDGDAGSVSEAATQSATQAEAAAMQVDAPGEADGATGEDESASDQTQAEAPDPSRTSGQAAQAAADQPDARTAAGDEPFDPDKANLADLIFWNADQSLHDVGIPDWAWHLFRQLIDSGHPGADKYIMDLAAFSTPFVLQVIDYLRDRYDTLPFNSVYDFPDLFDFDPSDSDTEAYGEFKHRIFAARLPDMGAFLDPANPRVIDARQILWGGVLVDGIPPLEFPNQETPQEAARWINDSDEVIGVSINGDARAYPIRIIAWHEMVNDTIGGLPVSLAYCTLCGAAVLYDGRLEGEVYRFGTSGLLYRSNKLMYDRQTNTLWNQFTGTPAWGPLAGQEIRLDVIPVVTTTWGEWRADHPDSTVLTIRTGFRRDYGPGVAYQEYNASPDTIFNVPIEDDRLPAKEKVFVVRIGEHADARVRGHANDAFGQFRGPCRGGEPGRSAAGGVGRAGPGRPIGDDQRQAQMSQVPDVGQLARRRQRTVARAEAGFDEIRGQGDAGIHLVGDRPMGVDDDEHAGGQQDHRQQQRHREHQALAQPQAGGSPHRSTG